MASIPLPALHTAPIAPPPNPLQMYGQMMGIQNAQQEMQQRQQMAPLEQQQAQNAVQSGQMDVQQRQIQLNDQKAMSAAMQQWAQQSPDAASSAEPAAAAGAGGTAAGAGGTPAGAGGTAAPAEGTPSPAGRVLPSYDSLIPLAIKNGASLQAVQALQAHLLDMKTKASEIAKNDAQTGSATATTIKANNGMISDAMTGVMSLPDAQLPQGILSAAQELSAKGIFDPQHMQQAQQLAQLAQTDPAQARQQLQIQSLSLGAFSKELDDQEKQAAHGALSADQISQLNQGLAQRFQATSGANASVPSAFQLGPTATQDDFARVDKLLSGTETAHQTAASLANSLALRQQSLAMMAGFRQAGLQNTQNQQLSQSFQYSNNFIQSAMKPLQQTAQKLGRLQATLSQANPQADALVAPELLSVMAGGQGSGLRMNEAEISRIIGGATKWTQLQQALNKFSTDPAHAQIPPEQRAQIQKLLNYVSGQANDQLNIGMQAQQDLIQATTPQEQHQVLARFSHQFTGSVTNQTGPGAAAGSAQAGAGQPAVGTVKTFPNGSKGIWDGRGWVAQ